jgi:hypothetical protein
MYQQRQEILLLYARSKLTRMGPSLAFFAFEDLSRTVLVTCKTAVLRGTVTCRRWRSGRDRPVRLKRSSVLNPVHTRLWRTTTPTFTRLVFDPASGVPSLFSALPCLTAAASSRIGRRWFRSAYLRHEMPHASHSTGVGKPFGAFHHSLVSRVRHAPHDACALLGVRTIEPSESESSADCTAFVDGGGDLEEPKRRCLRFSSSSFLLLFVDYSQIEGKRMRR